MRKPNNVKSCICCSSKNLKLKQHIKADELDKLYYKTFGFNCINEIKQPVVEYVECKKCSLQFFDTASAGSAKFYEDLQHYRNSYYNPNRPEFDFAKSFIKETDTVLEIGSGSGHFADRVKNNYYVGLEFNDLAIQKAKKRNINLKKQSIEDFANSENQLFDVVCHFHVLEHVTDVKNFMQASLRVLKPEGMLIVSVPCNDSILTNNVNHVLNLPPHHISRWTHKSLKKLGEIFNLNIIANSTHGTEETIDKKLYSKAKLTEKIIRWVYPSKTLLINEKKLKKINRISSMLNRKLKLYKSLKQDDLVNENITIVFKKL